MDDAGRRLPRGRHALPPEQVARAQRERLLAAVAEAMKTKGYAATSVGDVLKGAGVSRQTFYELFSSKLDCFMAAFDAVTGLLEERLTEAAHGDGTPLERFERAMRAYVGTLALEPGYARLFVVEVHAAGPEAIRRRAAFQGRLGELVGALLEARDEQQRFACRAVVAAVASLVTLPLVDGDAAALDAVAADIVAHVRLLTERGVLAGGRVESAAP